MSFGGVRVSAPAFTGAAGGALTTVREQAVELTAVRPPPAMTQAPPAG
ncbi:MAG TPA: hypothetical protein VGL26_04390 [Jatrophihabitans sp.]